MLEAMFVFIFIFSLVVIGGIWLAKNLVKEKKARYIFICLAMMVASYLLFNSVKNAPADEAKRAVLKELQASVFDLDNKRQIPLFFMGGIEWTYVCHANHMSGIKSANAELSSQGITFSGFSRSDEVFLDEENGLVFIDVPRKTVNLNATDVNYEINGNLITQESAFTQNGQTRQMLDVWLAFDTVNTVYTAPYDLDARVLFLPEQRGYGELPNLSIA